MPLVMNTFQTPENPERYDLAPRAGEIEVVYNITDTVTGQIQRRKDTLQCLLDRLAGAEENPVKVSMKQADPRLLLLDTASIMTKQLELIAKIEHAIPDTRINLTVNGHWQILEQIIYDATEDAPEVRKRIVEALS